MTSHLYIWKQIGRNKFGHAALDCSGSYMSWWPSEKASLLKKRNVLGEAIESYREDRDRLGGNDPDITLTLVDLDADAMVKFWEEFLEGGEKWKMLSQNCSTLIHRVLCKGHWFFKQYDRVVWTPDEIQDVAEKFIEEFMGGESSGKKVKPFKVI